MKKNHTKGSLSLFKRQIVVLPLMLMLGYFANAQNTWKGNTSGSWSNGANWSTGSAPTSTDVVTFNGSNINGNNGTGNITVTGVPTASIGRMVLLNGANVSLQPTTGSGNQVLTIGNTTTTDNDIDIPSGCQLTIASNSFGSFQITNFAGGDSSKISNALTLQMVSTNTPKANIAGNLTIQRNASYTLPSVPTLLTTTATSFSAGAYVYNGQNLYIVSVAGTATTSTNTSTAFGNTSAGGGGVAKLTYIGSVVTGTVSGTATNNTYGVFTNTYNVANGVTTVGGTIENQSASIANVNTSRLVFNANSNYIYNRPDGITNLPTGTDMTNVNVTIKGLVASSFIPVINLPTAMSSLTWYNPNVTTSASTRFTVASGTTLTVSGNVSIKQSASNSGMAINSGTTLTTVNIGGNLTLDSVSLAMSRNATAWNITGSFTMSSSNATVSVIDNFYAGAGTTSTLTVNDFTQNGGTFNLNNITTATTGQSTGALVVKGNFIKTAGTFTTTTTVSTGSPAGTQIGSLVFNGTSAQGFSLVGGFGNTPNVTINNSAGVTLQRSLSLLNSSILTLTSGKLSLDTCNLTIGSSASISTPSSTSYIAVSGTGLFIRQSVPTSSTLFPIGTSTSYAPLTLSGGTAGADITIGVKNTFTNAVVSGYANKVVNLEWSIKASANTKPSVTFQYNAADTSNSSYNASLAVLGAYQSGAYSETALSSVTGNNPYTTTITLPANVTSSTSYYGLGNAGSFVLNLGLPTNVVAVAGNASATITFTYPTNTSGITGYKVTASSGGFSVTSATSPVTIPGLNSGTAYTFTVASTDGTNFGAGVTSNSVTPTGNYTWSGATSTDFTVSTNWTPNRVTLGTGDALTFTSNATVTNVPTQTIGQLILSGSNTVVSLQPATGNGNQILTVGNTNTSDNDIQIPIGCELKIAANSYASFALPASYGGGANDRDKISNALTLQLASSNSPQASIDGKLTIQRNATYTLPSAPTLLTAGITPAVGSYIYLNQNLYAVTASTGATANATTVPGSTFGTSTANGGTTLTYIGSVVSGSIISSSTYGVFANTYNVGSGVTTVSATGTIENQSSSIGGSVSSTSLVFSTGSTYIYNREDGNGNIPTSANISGANIQVTGIVSTSFTPSVTIPSVSNSFTWNTPNITGSAAVRIQVPSGTTWTVNGDVSFTNGSNAQAIGANSSNISTVNINGNLTLSTISFYTGRAAADWTVTGNLSLSNSFLNILDGLYTTLTPVTSNLTVNGNVSLSGTSALRLNNLSTTSASTANLIVKGNLTVASTATLTTSSTTGQIGVLQFTGTGVSPQTFDYSGTVSNNPALILNNTGGLSLALSVSAKTLSIGNLTLTNGKLNLGNYNLSLASGASISPSTPSSASYISCTGTGLFTKVSVPSVGNTILPIGTSNSYAPLTLTGGTAGADITVGVKSTFTNTVVNSNTVVNLEWSLAASANTQPSVTFQYNASNQAGGYSSSGAVLGAYQSGAYSETALSSVGGTDPYTTTITVPSNITTSTSYFGLGNANSFVVNLGVPTNVVAVAGTASATISFDYPTNTTGITSYKVTASQGGFTVTSATSPVTITGLNSGTSYTFTVASSDGTNFGAGVTSNSVTPTGNYTWSGATSTDFTISTNWTPNRVTLGTGDALTFASNATVTNVPTQTIGQLILSGTSNVSLQPAAVSGNQTLTIGNSNTSDNDIQIPSGCQLTIGSNSYNSFQLTNFAGGDSSKISNALILQLAASNSPKASITGNLTIQRNATYTLPSAPTALAVATYSAGTYVYLNQNLYVISVGGTTTNASTVPSNTFGTSATNGTAKLTYIGSWTTGSIAANTIYGAFANAYNVGGGVTTVAAGGTIENQSDSIKGTVNNTSLVFSSGSYYIYNRPDFNHFQSAPNLFTNANVTITGLSYTVTTATWTPIIYFPSSMASLNLYANSVIIGPRFDIKSSTSISIGGNATIKLGAPLVSLAINSGSTLTTVNIGGDLTLDSVGLSLSRNATSWNISGSFSMSSANCNVKLIDGFYTSTTASATSTLTVTGDFIQNGGTFTINGIPAAATAVCTANLVVKGNFNQTAGTITTLNTVSTASGFTGPQVGNLIFKGTAPQTFKLAGGFSSTSPNQTPNLTINNSNGVTLQRSISLQNSSILTLTSGKLMLDTCNLTLGSSASISPATPTDTNYIAVSGTGLFIRQNVPTSATVFPIGTSSSYAPITLSGGTAGADITVGVKSTFTNAVLVANTVVNLEWSLAASTNTQPNVTFQYNSANQAGGYSSTGAVLGAYQGSYSETPLTSVSGSNPFTTTIGLPSTLTSATSYYGLGNVGSFVLNLGVPTNVVAVAGQTSATINFSLPNNTTGITGYRVTSNPAGFSSTITSNSVTFTGLNSGTTYTFSVAATDGTNFGSSVVSNAINPIGNYTWNGATSTDFQDPTNWTPNRIITTGTADALTFSSNATVTNVPSQTIGQLLLTGSTTSVSLQAATGASRTLTIGNGNLSGTDLNIPSGCTLTLATGTATNDALTIGFTGTPTASIAGSLVINPSFTSQYNNTYVATNSTTTVAGTVTNTGSITCTSTNMVFSSGSNYIHNRPDGTATQSFPLANFANANFTVQALVNATGTQTGFNNVPTTVASLVWNTPLVTGAGGIRLNSLVGSASTFTVTGNMTVTQGSVNAYFGFLNNTVTTVNIGGNLTLDNTTFNICRGNVNWTVTGNFTMSSTVSALVASDFYSGTSAITASLTVQNFTQNGGTFTLNSISSTATGASTGVLNVKGNFNKTAGTFATNTTVSTSSSTNGVAQTGSLVFNGTSPQTISVVGDISSTSPVGVTINNSNGVTLNSSLAIPNTGSLVLTSGTLTVGTNDTLQLPATVARTSGAINASGSTATVLLAAATSLPAAVFSPSTIGNLAITSAAPTLGQAITVSNTLSLNAGSSSNFTIANGGNLTVASGATVSRNKTGTGQLSFAAVPTYASLANTNFSYGGTRSDTLGSELPAGANTINNLTINNTGGITLKGNTTVNGTLALSAGRLLTLNNVLATAAITGGTASSYVVPSGTGTLKMTANAASAKLYPVGLTTGYAPLTITPSATQSYNVSVSGTYTTQPGDTTQVIKAQWTVLGTTAATTASVKFGYNTALFPTAYTATASEVGIDGGSGWSIAPSATATVPTTDSTSGATYYSLVASGLGIPVAGTNNYVVGNTGNVVVTATTWTGTASTNWTTPANWNNGTPSSTSDVTIAVATRYPVLTANTTVKNLTVAANAAVTNNKTLTVTGALTNNGTIGGTDTLVLGGSANQSVMGNGGTVGNLTLRNSTGATITAGNKLNVTGILTLQTGTLATNGNLVLKSNSLANSGVLAPVGTGGNSGAIIGTVQVERFVPLGYRAWRDLAPGVHNAGSIYNNWQEGGSYANAGYGVFITGTTSVSNAHGVDAATGLDQSPNSIKGAYTFGSTGWNAILNTKATNLNPFAGYRLLVRGDRTSNLVTSPVHITGPGLYMMWNATALRATGSLVTGNVTYATTGVTNAVTGATYNSSTFGLNGANDSAFNLVANPYVAPIDWKNITDNGRAVNLAKTYYYLDPTIGVSGAYVAYNSVADATSGGPVGTRRYIQAGQAFFVQNTATTPSLTITESDKAVGTTKTAVFGSTARSLMSIGLNKADGTEVRKMDVATVVFDPAFSNGVGAEDALKMTNPGENLSFGAEGKQFSILGRQDAAPGERLPLALQQLKSGNYELNIDATAFKAVNLAPYLADAYTHESILIAAAGNTFGFQVDASKPETYTNRFSIVFKDKSVLVGQEERIAQASSLGIYPNPLVGRKMTVSLNKETTSGKYSVNIVNALGQNVHSQSFDYVAGQSSVVLGLPKGLPSGQYQVVVRSVNGQKTIGQSSLNIQ